MAGLYEFKKEDAYRFAQAVNAETREVGGELRFKFCPYCKGGKNHDMNTFSINLKTGAWNCKRGSCGRKASNMIPLAQDFKDFSLGSDGIDDYYLKRDRFKKFIRRPYKSKDRAIEYLKGRGIPEEITQKYEITIDKKDKNIMVFPFVDERGEYIRYIKYRNLNYQKGISKAKEWSDTNKKDDPDDFPRMPILFGMNHCNFENSTLVMTEGQIDCLSCAAAGIENAVSVPSGKNGFTWVPYCYNFLGRFEELIVFGDYENGSISLLDGMRSRFHGKVKHVREEDYKDCKDANEILLKYGPEAIRACIENAEPCPVEGLKKMSDIQRVRLSELERMRIGIDAVDKQCPFIFGELVVLTGAAGDGKSTMASQWVTMAISQGFPSMIYSGEMQSWMVKIWIDKQIAGSRNLNRYDDIDDSTYERMVNWPGYQNLYMYDINDTEDNQETLFKVILKGIQQYGIRFIVLDNLMTAMDHEDGLELNEAQTVFTKQLAKIAQDQNVIIVLIVHPRKAGTRQFSNDDIAGSSNIVNRAHKTIRYARPDKEFTDKDGYKWQSDELHDCPIRMLTVLKDRITGKTISKGIPLYFEEHTKRIWDGEGKDGFDWQLGWEEEAEFQKVDDLDEIPF